ncbi:MAG: 2-C-methyl-D-erythritol 4-phosphate cytidylyltransferase [Bacteroidales bacterium]|nr:2-C-methyl-D-erythritol 4-phosphate cytidylyltransferase [Candidatus Cryptobacteroides aphodequi]
MNTQAQIARIRAILSEKGMSQRELAALLGKTEAEVSRWMSGRVGISQKNIARISGALGEDISNTSAAKDPCERRNIGVILAGGQSGRQETPFLLTPVDGRALIAYTIELYQNHPGIDAIELVCDRGQIETLQRLVRKYGFWKEQWICEGGVTYQGSVYNAIQNLEEEIGPDDLVLIHYGNAPYTAEAIISDAIRVAGESGNAISSTPCYQLLGHNEGDGTSRSALDRDSIVQLACPQAFVYKYIKSMYDSASEGNLLSKVEPHTTSLLYRMGQTLHLSYGNQSNIKITTPEDLELFEAFVRVRKEKK